MAVHGRRSGIAIAASLLAVLALFDGAEAQDQNAPLRWYKGNTHTHTLNSDGDSTPDEVVRWYREHNYQFLVLTDHNYLTSVDGLNALHGGDERFLVIRGEEVTDRFETKPIHVNGLDLSTLVAPQGGSSVVDVLQRNVDAIRDAKGIPHINHPNYGWAISPDELRQVRNTRFFEIFNGHPHVNNLGGGDVPALEQAWDQILTAGTWLYGIAVDDAHTFKQPGNPAVPGPGRGWVMVRAPRLETRAILGAMERGDFYATTGVELAEYEASSAAIRVVVRVTAYSKYRVQFIGRGGQVLSEVPDSTAVYSFTGTEGYVRAKVIESNGYVAWCQPIAVSKGAAARMTKPQADR